MSSSPAQGAHESMVSICKFYNVQWYTSGGQRAEVAGLISRAPEKRPPDTTRGETLDTGVAALSQSPIGALARQPHHQTGLAG